MMKPCPDLQLGVPQATHSSTDSQQLQALLQMGSGSKETIPQPQVSSMQCCNTQTIKLKLILYFQAYLGASNMRSGCVYGTRLLYALLPAQALHRTARCVSPWPAALQQLPAYLIL
jgi:hypothetical protein